ncbi:cbb3-type cytochrome c oxidase subunit 3 [Myxococcota bacterium]|nr:cbb3-type cytochrome c oxidase subunit 3 [Myxococcota bacterium]
MIDDGIVRGAIAIVSLVSFLAICWWAYRPKSRARFEADAWLVFEDGDRVETVQGGIPRASGPAGLERGERGASA